MKISIPLDAETEAGLFIEITSVARRYVWKLVGSDNAKDIAQDVVLECLQRLRLATSPIDLERIPGLAREMAQRRAVDLLRREGRRPRHDEDYMRELTASTHSWMEPDTAIHEEELEEFRERTMAKLPKRCRRAYTLVREEGRTYDEVAATLGVSRATVNAHVVAAHRRFRQGLPQQDVPAPRATRGGRQRGTQKGSDGAGGRSDTLPEPPGTTRMRARSPTSGQPTPWRR